MSISQLILPNEIYTNLNFEEVKKQIKKIYNSYSDYGSILLIKDIDYSFSVNEFGNIRVISNKVNEVNISEIVDNVEKVFNVINNGVLQFPKYN